jgi:Mlc titration factor MtfA (ptsG expression regulator)
MLGFLKKRRRQELRRLPFPEPWRNLLLRRFPVYAWLPAADKEELEGHIQVFLAEKNFEGCGGQEITDEIKVLITAQACLLLLHRDTDYYPGLRSILVYPSTYVARTASREEEEIDSRESRARLGESWQQGAVVLAWDSTVAGAADPADGGNLVFHEFAHQLDQEDGVADGVPPLSGGSLRHRRGRYAAWVRILGDEYEQLVATLEEGHAPLLDEYGATNPAEFFAVATEYFFEQPRQLKDRHPELYEQLRQFYQQNPVEYFPG